MGSGMKTATPSAAGMTEAWGKPDWLAVPGGEEATFYHKVLF